MGRSVQHTDDEKLAKLRERQRRNQANKYKRDKERAAQYEKEILNLDQQITHLIASCRQRLNEGNSLNQSKGYYNENRCRKLTQMRTNVEHLAKEFETFNNVEEKRQPLPFEEADSVVPDFSDSVVPM